METRKKLEKLREKNKHIYSDSRYNHYSLICVVCLKRTKSAYTLHAHYKSHTEEEIHEAVQIEVDERLETQKEEIEQNRVVEITNKEYQSLIEKSHQLNESLENNKELNKEIHRLNAIIRSYSRQLGDK